MARVLADPSLYEPIGGEPPTVKQLAARYRRLARGSPDSSRIWLNWVLCPRGDEHLLGWVQATVGSDLGAAELGWMVERRWQRQGIASEASTALAVWLLSKGVRRLVAHIAPGHLASEKLAGRLGMSPTERLVEGELEWSFETQRVAGPDHSRLPG